MRYLPRFLGRASFVGLVGATALCASSAVVPPALAQSAADKATARQLATEGIELFKAGKIPEALDKLQRAQQLYDAPVHLIYIARSHAQLGQFVEAAEAYRRLVRTQLPDNAPAVFKDAVADAKKELPDVDPKIASLRIDVEPKGVQGLELKIDDAPVSSAALGVDRPVNPGSRKITASAPGYKPLEQTLELKPGEKKKLALSLEADGSGEGSGAGAGSGEGSGSAEGGKGDGGAAGGSAEPKGNFGFLVGLRVGGWIPAGQLAEGYPMKDYIGPGGGIELRGGVRVFKRYSALLIASGESYQPGAALEKGPASSIIKVTPGGTNAGLGLMYAAPPGELGPFFELGFLFLHRFEVKREVTWQGNVNPACEQTLKAHGTALRLLGGLQVPMTPWLQLSPYAGLAFGQVTDFSADDGCDGSVPLGPVDDTDKITKKTPWWDGENAADKPAGHFVVTFGVGGDILFGSDKPSK
ncbi:MAG: hypothetical protein IPM35_31410 [Myxococcales bacterium]|nr:hypothetical protein [Myxococcales bacterium]